MDKKSFAHWLESYGHAWQQRDPEKFAALFTEDAEYHWTPFGPPKSGHREIADAFRMATASQREILFDFDILSTTRSRGVAHWWCSFTRMPTGHTVHLDGILTVDATTKMLCRQFREWWHSDEAH